MNAIKFRKFLRINIPWLDGFIHFLYTLPARIYGSYKLRHPDETVKIVLGSSGIFDKGWIPVEQSLLDIRNAAQWQKLFREESVQATLAEHVLEHLTEAECAVVMEQVYRVTKPGGYFRIAVPDGLHPDPMYRESVRPGGTGIGAESHKALYTWQSLSAIAEKAGFTVRLLEYFDVEGNFHYKAWDIADGLINRSSRFDRRNAGGELRYTSLIIDAVK